LITTEAHGFIPWAFLSQSHRYNADMNKDRDPNQLLERIVSDQQVMVGKPVIRGTRLTVERVLDLLAHGETSDDIVGQYPGLEPQDIRACLAFASQSLSRTAFLPLTGESA